MAKIETVTVVNAEGEEKVVNRADYIQGDGTLFPQYKGWSIKAETPKPKAKKTD